MKQPNVTVYGSRNCPDTTRALRFLDRQEVPYEFRDLAESPELDSYVAALNQGKRVLPTIQIDNAVLINPSDQELGSVVQQAASERP
jgi:thioredoxin reductase (NADPH)